MREQAGWRPEPGGLTGDRRLPLHIGHGGVGVRLPWDAPREFTGPVLRQCA